jgi:hypothetical protein
MNAIAALYADQALRLADERANGFRREADHDRLAAIGRSNRGRFAGLRAAIASFRNTVTAVDPVGPALPTLIDYPYRG